MKRSLFQVFLFCSVSTFAQQIWVAQDPVPFIQFTDLKCQGFSIGNSTVYNSHDLLRTCGSNLLIYDFDLAYWKELPIEINTNSIEGNIQLYNMNDSLTILHGGAMNEFILNGIAYEVHPQYKLLVYFNHIDKQVYVDTINSESFIEHIQGTNDNVNPFVDLLEVIDSDKHEELIGLGDINEYGQLAYTYHLEKNGYSSIHINRLSLFNPSTNKHKYLPHPTDSIHRYGELLYWRNYLILECNKKIYITDTSDISWRVFSDDYNDFAVGADRQILAVLQDSCVQLFNTPTNRRSIQLPNSVSSDITDRLSIASFTHKDHILLEFRDQRIALHEDKFIPVLNQAKLNSVEKMPFSYEYPAFNSSNWSIEGHSIYHLNDNKYSQVLEFITRPNNLIETDSTHLLIQYHNQDYIFDLDKMTLSTYEPSLPISNFLSSGLDRIDFTYAESGCFHMYSQVVHLVNGQTKPNYLSDTSDVITTLAKDDSISLYQILSEWNAQPTALPTLDDFHISINDIETYLSLYQEIEPSSIETLSIQARIDTISPEYFENRIKSQPEWGCTSSIRIEFVLTNNQGDHLEIKYVDATCSIRNAPHLPWTLTYNSIEYRVYDPELTKVILGMIKPHLNEMRMNAIQMNLSNAYLLQILLRKSVDRS